MNTLIAAIGFFRKSCIHECNRQTRFGNGMQSIWPQFCFHYDQLARSYTTQKASHRKGKINRGITMLNPIRQFFRLFSTRRGRGSQQNWCIR
ncbi:Uncharacterised protein [Vibrio cholerae]|nr:Uncharacterised protein [Vibrio cholerae]CSC99495.1 Uncharacterised protein [Vibrio cholerae]